MGRLIKYEIKNTYKIILGILLVLVLLNVFLMNMIGVWREITVYGFIGIIDTLSVGLILGFALDSFQKELFTDRAYLTFTLPVKGRDIVGSKLIVALMWLGITALTIVCLMFIRFDVNIGNFLQNLVKYSTHIIMLILFLLIGLIIFITLVYFSIALSKMAVNNKKLGGFVGFLFFLILSIVVIYIEVKFVDFFSLSLVFTDKEITLQSVVNSGSIEFMGGKMTINLSIVITNIILAIGLFFGSSYLLDKKVNL